MPGTPDEPYLLTPGPLTTSDGVKRAMLRDWGSRDQAFIELNARVGRRLVALAGAEDTHVAVPLQGQLESLNVSVTAGILMFERARQIAQG